MKMTPQQQKRRLLKAFRHWHNQEFPTHTRQTLALHDHGSMMDAAAGRKWRRQRIAGQPPKRWMGDDHAWLFLKSRGLKETKCTIHRPDRPLTRSEDSAIDYLCRDWDWFVDGPIYADES